MISMICELTLAESGQELQPRGTALFPCSAYAGELHRYFADQVPPHWHRELEFFVLDEGRVTASLAGQEYTLLPGQGFFVNNGVLHGIRCAVSGSCRYRSLVFDADIVAGAAGSVFDTLYLGPLQTNGPRAAVFSPDTDRHQPPLAAFEKAFSACAAEAPGYEFMARSALSQMLFPLCTHLAKDFCHECDSRQERMKQMLSYLDDHYAEPVTLSSLSAAANICERECERCFAHFLHISPMAYLLRRRCAAAAKLLTAHALPVTEVGLLCGFSSPSYFAKQFSAIMGCSPRAFRAKKAAPIIFEKK